jgi:hypothetical protein
MVFIITTIEESTMLQGGVGTEQGEFQRQPSAVRQDN